MPSHGGVRILYFAIDPSRVKADLLTLRPWGVGSDQDNLLKFKQIGGSLMLPYPVGVSVVYSRRRFKT